jgi:hypothetical protein
MLPAILSATLYLGVEPVGTQPGFTDAVITSCVPADKAASMKDQEVLGKFFWQNRFHMISRCQTVSALYWLNNKPKAVELFAIGRIHYFYDTLRCNNRDRNGPYDSDQASIMYIVSGPLFGENPSEAEAEANQKLLLATFKRLVSTDEVFASEDGLELACRDNGGVKPRTEWSNAVASLRSQLSH